MDKLSDDCEIVNILLVDEVGEDTNNNPVKIKGKTPFSKNFDNPPPIRLHVHTLIIPERKYGDIVFHALC